MTEIPNWLVSKYFYREMSPVLRYAILPFLLLFDISVLFLVVFGLAATGIWSAPLTFLDRLLGDLSVIGVLVDIVLVVNVVVIVFLLLLSIPAFFVVRDARKTLSRFGLIDLGEPGSVTDRYTEGAREVFAAHPEVAVFVYGHTHRAAVTEVDDRVVVNTGTWLKRLHRQSVLFGLVPWVFYPSFRLNYVRITEEEGAVAVDYRVIEKPNPTDLTLLERLLTRKPRLDDPIPARVVVDHDWKSSSPAGENSLQQSPSGEPGEQR